MSGSVPCCRSIAGWLSIPGCGSQDAHEARRKPEISSPHRCPGGCCTCFGVQQPPSQARPPEKPRCTARGAASGFHASRYALAFRNLFCFPMLLIAIFSPIAILPPFVFFVNSICVYIAACNEILIVNCNMSGYNDCRLQ